MKCFSKLLNKLFNIRLDKVQVVYNDPDRFARDLVQHFSALQ